MSDPSRQPDQERRNFLGTAAAATAALAVAPGLTLFNVAGAKPEDQAVTSANRWGMLVDANKCADGCRACVEACHEENGISSRGRPTTDPQWIRTVTLRDRTTGRETRMPVMCQHCEHPPCVDVCPTGASFRRADGIVLVDRHICIGCRYCMLACPYGIPRYDWDRAAPLVRKCILCQPRISEGKRPACVEACPEEVMFFGTRDEMLAEGRRRIAARPKDYLPRIWGETFSFSTSSLAGNSSTSTGTPST